MLDPVHYPRTTEYLSKLPKGLESYPECLMHADVLDQLRSEFPQVLQVLPCGLDEALRPGTRQAWVREAQAVAAFVAVRDTQFVGDAEYLGWAYDVNAALLRRPIFRAAFYVLSTSLLVMGATRKWSTFHQGSALEARPVAKEAGRLVAQASLTFPPYLFPRLMVESFVQAYRAALDATRAPDPRVEIQNVRRTQADFVLSWEA